MNFLSSDEEKWMVLKTKTKVTLEWMTLALMSCHIYMIIQRMSANSKNIL